MINLRTILSLGLVVSGVACLAAASAEPSLQKLEAGFQHPADSAKPYLWWHWMNGNVSREGITKDLEAMKRVGIGGLTLFEEFNRTPAGSVRYASPEHFSLIQFAADECQRLGLDFGFHNCPGWSSSGGPWITPEQAMKNIIWSETQVRGSGLKVIKLARPPTKVEAYRSSGHTYEDHDFYRDVVVIAFPTPKDADVRLDDFLRKAVQVVPIGYGLQEQTKDVPADGVVDIAQIQVLKQTLNADGELEWEVPAGNWTVLRFGYILTGHVNQQGPTTGGRGLECDKLSKAALDFHWEHFVGRVVDSARAGGSNALSTVLIDSYEADVQTWTPRMPEEFQRLRGYSMLAYLPCLAGRVLGSVADTERFLWDFRRTIAELVEENYYGHFANRCRDAGLKASFEGYGYNGIFDDFDVSRRADIPMCEFWAGIYKYSHWGVKVAASASDLNGRHLVGVEGFTSGGADAAWKWHPYTLKAQGDHYLSRGVTRFYIQASVHQPWADHVKPGMTYGLHGIQMNRNNTWWEQSRGWLAHLARTQAMLQQGALVADICYYYGENEPATLRTQSDTALNRLGVPWDPEMDMNPDVWFRFPEGHDFHVVSQKLLMELSVNDAGQVTHPSGMRYEVLILSDEQRMRLQTLRKIAELVQAGATVVGPKPLRSPSLEDGPSGSKMIRRLADQVWGEVDGKHVTVHAYGRGRVFHGLSIEEVLRQKRVTKDFAYEALDVGAKTSPRLSYQHRSTPEADFYFVSNQRNEATAVRVRFRQGSLTSAPEIWKTETGAMEVASIWSSPSPSETMVTLNLDPAESCFVVFPKKQGTASASPRITALEKEGAPVVNPAVAQVRVSGKSLALRAFASGTYGIRRGDQSNQTIQIPTLRPVLDLNSGWTVQFPVNPTLIRKDYDRLGSWSEQSDDTIKYFSGTATYTKSFELSPDVLSSDAVVELDLGSVEVIAELQVNGTDYGVLWKPPFRRDITQALKPGKNTVTVKVTNLWRNRLIGDAAIRGYDKSRRNQAMAKVPFSTPPKWVEEGRANPDTGTSTFTMSPFYSSADKLIISGLLGPVTLNFGKQISLEQALPPSGGKNRN